jgi:hypothetical protein
VLEVVEEGDDVELEVVEDGEEDADEEDDIKVLDDEGELEDDGVPELALELPRDKKDDDVAGQVVDVGQGVDVVVGHGVDVLEGVLHIVVFEME